MKTNGISCYFACFNALILNKLYQTNTTPTCNSTTQKSYTPIALKFKKCHTERPFHTPSSSKFNQIIEHINETSYFCIINYITVKDFKLIALNLLLLANIPKYFGHYHPRHHPQLKPMKSSFSNSHPFLIDCQAHMLLKNVSRNWKISIYKFIIY